jgi:hypothetical protein
MLTEQQIKRGIHRSTHALEKAIKQYILLTNENPNHLSGLKRLMKSLLASPNFVSELQGQDTRSLNRCFCPSALFKGGR